jgi:hypothetical protein
LCLCIALVCSCYGAVTVVSVYSISVFLLTCLDLFT